MLPGSYAEVAICSEAIGNFKHTPSQTIAEKLRLCLAAANLQYVKTAIN